MIVLEQSDFDFCNVPIFYLMILTNSKSAIQKIRFCFLFLTIGDSHGAGATAAFTSSIFTLDGVINNL